VSEDQAVQDQDEETHGEAEPAGCDDEPFLFPESIKFGSAPI